MKRKFYTLAVLPLLFVACSSQKASESAPAAQKVSNTTVVQEEVVQSGSATDVKYVADPMVIKRGMAHIKGFAGTLQPTLKSALAQDKTQEVAMGACSSVAMQMTDDYNRVSPNAKIRRTALKYRNPANKPDATDTEVMYRLQAVNDGKPVAVDMGNKYRVYKPLKIKQSCLLCHGDPKRMSPQVVKILHTKYPHDLATGFKLGDFRGVIVAEISK